MIEYTWQEIKKHNSPETGVWIVMDNLVYDVTKFDKHPGQFDILQLNAGKDATQQFNTIHSEKARKMREKFVIGKVKQLDVNDPNYEVQNVIPESDVPGYYYLLPITLFLLFIILTYVNNK